ncbi:toxin glutamine deamidase domain-containing protein [Kitasatospora sp. NPDC051853]|uniref:toxin glutamine deamidase domain-containing protein n=1 Tax=Kitasatospora sp. NPDC051853 TaxID=3364058 RepID=UPI003791AB63
MAVELPEPLQWVLMLLAGSRWPEGDEDLMRDMARRWRSAAESVDEGGRAADSAMKRALDGQQGAAMDELAKKWETLTLPVDGSKPGFFPGMVKACNSMADSLEAMANSTETAKISIVAQLGILAFEIATAEAAAPVTAGASLAAIPVAIQASKMTVQQILKKLAKEIIVLALKEAFQEVAINLLAQSIQLAAGNRKELDGKELGMSAAGGAIGGAAGGVLGKGLGAAGNKLIGKNMDRLPAQMVEGAITDVGADAFTQFALTGEVDAGQLGGSALSGAGSPAIMRGASALKGKFNSSDIPDASDFTGGGTDGPGAGGTGGTASAGSGGGTAGDSGSGAGAGNSSSGSESSSDSGGSTGDHGPTPGKPGSNGNDADVDPSMLSPIGSDGHHTRGGGDFDAPASRGPAADGGTPQTPTPRNPDAPRTFAAPSHDTTVPTPETAPYQGPTSATPRTDAAPHLAPYEPPAQRSAPDTTPTPSVPTAHTESPAPRTEAPTPRAESPAPPHVETPTPRAEAPAPRTETAPTPSHESTPSQDNRPSPHESSSTPTSSAPPRGDGAPNPGHPTGSTAGAPHPEGVRLASGGPAAVRAPSHDTAPSTPDAPSVPPARSADSPVQTSNGPGVPVALGPVNGGRRGAGPQPAPAAPPTRPKAEPVAPPAPTPANPTRPRPERGAPPTDSTPDSAPIDSAPTDTAPTDSAPAPEAPPALRPPATAGRPLGGEGGLTEPTGQDLERLKQALPPRDGDDPHPDPDPGSDKGDWIAAINGDGPEAPGRTNNCVDTTLAFLDTYHGNPTPAAARTPDPDADGNPSALGERNGRDRIENNLGARFTDLGDGPAAFDRLKQTLVKSGHGSAAAITTVDADGRSHAWNAVNHKGTVTYVDAQTGRRSNEPLHQGENGVFAIPLGPDRSPVTPEPHADPDHDPATERRAPERPAADTGFPSPGPRVAVYGDGLCLLRSLVVSAPDLTGGPPAAQGSSAQQLKSRVRDHFDGLAPQAWPLEIVSNYRGQLPSRPDLTKDDLLAYLPEDVRNDYGQLPLPDLREIVVGHITESAPPPTPEERAGLLETVDQWASRWGTPQGEMLPAAAAHALGLRLRVVNHDGVPLAVFGPNTGQPVTVYHRGNHYDGSGPSPVAGGHESAAPKPVTAASKPAPAAESESETKPKDDEKPKDLPEDKPEKDAEDKPEEKSEDKPEKDAEEKSEDKPEKDAEEKSEDKPEKDAEDKPEEKSEETSEDKSEQPKQDPDAPRPIAGNDLVVGLNKNEQAVRDQVIAVLTESVPGDRAVVRAFADAHFSPATLRPMVSALSRGETVTVPFEGDGFSGSIKLSGAVTKSVPGSTQKIEFENGADRTVSLGSTQSSQLGLNIGIQTRQSTSIVDPAQLAGYFHDRGQSRVKVDLGGMVARTKTSVNAQMYDSTMKLELDFGGLRHGGKPVHPEAGKDTSTVDLGVTVAVPKVPDALADKDLRTAPPRLQGGRIGGQEVVLDLSPKGGPQGGRPVEALLDQVQEAGEKEFGKDWPAMRDKVLSEVDFARLQRDLKGMTAGEPTTVTLTDKNGRPLGTVEISAKLGGLQQTGVPTTTEFNIGTTVQQVRSTAENRGNAGQFGLGLGVNPGALLANGVASGRLGQDRIEISGNNRVSQLTVKSKVPGVRYDGTVDFTMTFNGKPDVHQAGSADVKLMVDEADTTDPAKPAEPRPTEVATPPDSVWKEDGGLGETVVVRDLETTAALRKAVDEKGRAEFGDDWDAVRDQVLQGFSQPNLAAKLTGMTRGEPLEIKVPGKKDLVVTATAKVESMTFRRNDTAAELNTVNETGSFGADRRLMSRTAAADGHLGLAAKKSTPPADLLATAAGHQRDRVGAQGRRADRVYANGKYAAPQVIYGAKLTVDVHFGKPGEAPGRAGDPSAPLDVEISMDALDTVKKPTPDGEDGSIAFTRPTAPAEGPAPKTEDKGAEDKETEGKETEDKGTEHTPPARMSEQHELNASYVVHTLSGADKVRAEVEGAIRKKHGEPTEEVRQRIDDAFDRVALKTQLSQLTRGGKITETVSGATWKAEITVTAKLGGVKYHSEVGSYEFESGTRTSRGQGNVQDHRTRTEYGGQLKVKTPVVDVTGGYSHRTDRTYAHGVETVGSTSNRAKHTEAAAFFDVGVDYDVKVEFKRLGFDDGSVTVPVGTTARVAVPMRDADPKPPPVPPKDVEGPGDGKEDGKEDGKTEPPKQPKGYVNGKRLDSSAVVTDVHLPAGRPRVEGMTLGQSILSEVEAKAKQKPGAPVPQPKLKADPFGGDRDGIRRKLDQELTPDRLQARLKSMTAGDAIVVRHGNTTVRVTAVLGDKMDHLGGSGKTEFNTGTDVQQSVTDSAGNAGSHQGRLAVMGSAPVPGSPVSVTAGLTGTGGKGQDHTEVHSSSTSAGSATKAKVAGSAYQGEAELQFTITRTPLFGPSTFERRTATIGFETIVETSETVPPAAEKPAAEKPTAEKPAADAPRPEKPPLVLPTEAPAPTEVRIPPERVWESGLRDSDVLRFLGDVGGVQDLVRLRGPEYFGKSTWQSMEPVVGAVTSHSQLSALFNSATQGGDVSATLPTSRLTLGGGKGVEVGMKIVSLEHEQNDPDVESSPSNSSSTGVGHSDQSVKNAGLRAQVGAKIPGDVVHNPAVIGGAQRIWREGDTHGDAGQIVSNGKYPNPMARYSGAVQVEVTLFDGKRDPVKESGVLPFTVDIPLTDTTKADRPGDHQLAFTPENHTGELRFDEDPGLAADILGALPPTAPPAGRATATPEQKEQLAGTVRLVHTAFGEHSVPTPADLRTAHRLVELGGGTTGGTATLLGGALGTPEGTAPNAPQLRRVIASMGLVADHSTLAPGDVRSVHRLVELGGSVQGATTVVGDLFGTPEGTAPNAAQIGQVIAYMNRISGDGPVTLDDLYLGAAHGWPQSGPRP